MPRSEVALLLVTRRSKIDSIEHYLRFLERDIDIKVNKSVISCIIADIFFFHIGMLPVYYSSVIFFITLKKIRETFFKDREYFGKVKICQLYFYVYFWSCI